MALAELVGTTLGVALGYLGGAPDILAMRLFDVLFAFPPSCWPSPWWPRSAERLNLILTIAVLTLPQFAVLARSATWP